MNPKIQTLHIAELMIQVIRKKVKSLRLGIYPPDGTIRVSAPLRYSDQLLVSFLTGKLEWIRKHREKILAQPRPQELNYISGENHTLFGKTYLLQLTEHPKSRTIIHLHHTTIEMQISHGSTKIQREESLLKWYREQLKLTLPSLFEKWSLILGVQVNQWGIKKMKTRWGSCNPRTKRISISLELAKYSHQTIEYVVCHELAHLLEPSHNQRFKKIMSAAIPDWKLRRSK